MQAPASAPLRALLVAAVALPGMVGAARADDDEEVGIQYSHYEEGARALYHQATTGTIAASPGSTVTGNTYGVLRQAGMPPVKADGEHAYARFRLSDHARLSFDFAQDVWSGASPLATVPAAMSPMTGASIGDMSKSSYTFDANGHPLYQSALLPNANAGNPGGTPQRDIWSNAGTQITHVMGYASPEARKQASVKYGYEWDGWALDGGAGISSEPDFRAEFGNVNIRLDRNDKRTTWNAGLSFTHGDTFAEGHTDIFQQMSNDTGLATTVQPWSYMGGLPFVIGTRKDLSLTGGVTQVLGRNDLLSTGFGYTRSAGFLTNPWKGAVVFYAPNPSTDPFVIANYPGATIWLGALEHERRPSLRNQFTWDTSYLHYVERLNAAAQAHYSLFVDSWGIAAHSVDFEWRQSVGSNWTVTPRLRYYTQKAARFYAPYFFAHNLSDLASRNFSSDERLSAFGTINPGLTISRQLGRGLSAELGFELSKRSGAYKLGGGGDGDYADLHSYTANLALKGNLAQMTAGMFDGLGEGPSLHMAHAGHAAHADVPAGVMGAHMMDDPGAVMLGYTLEHDILEDRLIEGTHTLPKVPYTSSPIPGGGNMLPTAMTMNMHMLDLMVALDPRVNLMVMPQLVYSYMEMVMVGSGRVMTGGHVVMRSIESAGGIGDTEVAALIRLWDGQGQHLHLKQGISVPTGSVDERAEGTGALFAYDMQPGSGTWDYKPALTYTGLAGRWSWGAQVDATKRLQNHNSSYYALGDQARGTAWGGYRFLPWLSGSLRLQYTAQGKLNSNIPAAAIDMPSVDAHPGNYGGHFADLGIGVTAALGTGAYSGNRIGLEWMQPVYGDYYGIQMVRLGNLIMNWSFSF